MLVYVSKSATIADPAAAHARAVTADMSGGGRVVRYDVITADG